jgi:hemerythrin
MKVTWCESLESGFGTIDEQHQELFKYINNFFANISGSFEHEETVRTLNFLVKYVKYHFQTEEELMCEYTYDNYKEHLKNHQQIVADLVDCYKKLISSGNVTTVVEDLEQILQYWFVEHIMGHDMKLAKYLKNNA